jgi:hypothetical protein
MHGRDVMKTNTNHRSSTAERAGRWAGRVWRGLLRQEAHLYSWMVARGLSRGFAKALLWAANFLVAGAALVVTVGFVVALAFFTAFLVASKATARDEEENGVWRDGLQGYGCYQHGARTDANRLFEDEES